MTLLINKGRRDVPPVLYNSLTKEYIFVVQYLFFNSINICSVGKNISTKRPDGKPFVFDVFDKNRLDLTNEYKYPEGNYMVVEMYICSFAVVEYSGSEP